jgi:hypothetical protein
MCINGQEMYMKNKLVLQHSGDKANGFIRLKFTLNGYFFFFLFCH